MIRTGKEKKAGGREGETMMSAEINRRKEAVNEGKERRGKTKEGERESSPATHHESRRGRYLSFACEVDGANRNLCHIPPPSGLWMERHDANTLFNPPILPLKRLIISVDSQSLSVTQEIHRGEKLI